MTDRTSLENSHRRKAKNNKSCIQRTKQTQPTTTSADSDMQHARIPSCSDIYGCKHISGMLHVMVIIVNLIYACELLQEAVCISQEQFSKSRTQHTRSCIIYFATIESIHVCSNFNTNVLNRPHEARPATLMSPLRCSGASKCIIV